MNIKTLEEKGWTKKDNRLQKQYVFKDFVTCMWFVQEVAIHCEKLQYHPEWKNIYNKLWVELTTHDKNAITTLDYALAEIMEEKFSFFKKNKINR